MTEAAVQNAFVPEVLTYIVHDKKLVLAPIPFKRFKEAIKVCVSAIDAFQLQPGKTVQDLALAAPEAIEDKLVELLPIIFPGQAFTKEWVSEHVSLALANQLLRDAMRVNGVTDFFAGLKGEVPKK